MQAFVPRNRRPKFQLQLRIIDLNNVPLVSGSSFIKWHLPHSAAAEHRGRTHKCSIREHAVIYDYTKSVPVRLSIDKNNNLQSSYINFEVVQEYSSGARGERIVLGTIRLNLAEYVEASEADEEDGVVRRYLMMDSKINSTLKIGIQMRLTDGDRNFVAPALKSAPVFGGIAGIIAGEQGDSEETGHIPSLSSKSREAGEAQDMYRLNLAAFLNAQPGELPADECIEDIFAGGDGWGSPEPSSTPPSEPSRNSWRQRSGYQNHIQNTNYTNANAASRSGSSSPYRSTSTPNQAAQNNHNRKQSTQSLTPAMAERPPTSSHGFRSQVRAVDDSSNNTNSPNGVTGRTSLEQNTQKIRRERRASGKEREREAAEEEDEDEDSERRVDGRGKATMEVDEFEVREDLRSWTIPTEVK